LKNASSPGAEPAAELLRGITDDHCQQSEGDSGNSKGSYRRGVREVQDAGCDNGNTAEDGD
jgi:hypothetical protein